MQVQKSITESHNWCRNKSFFKSQLGLSCTPENSAKWSSSDEERHRHCHLTGNHGKLWTKTSKRQSCHRILIPEKSSPRPIQTCCNWKLELSEPVYFSISPQPPFTQQAMSGGEFVCLALAMAPSFLICLQLATIIIANVIKISSGPPWPPVKH